MDENRPLADGLAVHFLADHAAAGRVVGEGAGAGVFGVAAGVVVVGVAGGGGHRQEGAAGREGLHRRRVRGRGEEIDQRQCRRGAQGRHGGRSCSGRGRPVTRLVLGQFWRGPCGRGGFVHLFSPQRSSPALRSTKTAAGEADGDPESSSR